MKFQDPGGEFPFTYNIPTICNKYACKIWNPLLNKQKQKGARALGIKRWLDIKDLQKAAMPTPEIWKREYHVNRGGEIMHNYRPTE